MNQHFKGQLELGQTRSPEKDRNHHLGGRSFYFFDFDENIAFLQTPMILFHRLNRSELAVSSVDWAHVQHQVGKPGPYEDYVIEWDDVVGSFRYFRDHAAKDLIQLGLKNQIFVEDVVNALGHPDTQWKGPSWDCFYHATFNQRPTSLITARGHHPSTFQEGIRAFVEKGHLPLEPNYLSILPVSHPDIRRSLGDDEFKWNTPQLKQAAIRLSVEKAFETYGYSPHHRFGMSDDDPRNIQSIYEELHRLKNKYPEVSFSVIDTNRGKYIKHEVLMSGETSGELVDVVGLMQLDLFDSP